MSIINLVHHRLLGRAMLAAIGGDSLLEMSLHCLLMDWRYRLWRLGQKSAMISLRVARRDSLAV